MKFLSITFLALGLGSQVLAAPAILNVAEIESDVAIVARDASPVGSDISFVEREVEERNYPTTPTYPTAPATYPTTKPATYPTTSAVGYPAQPPTGYPAQPPTGYPVGNVGGIVVILQKNITIEFTAITAIIKPGITVDIAIDIKKSLTIIAASLQHTILIIGPIIKGLFVGLVEAEIKILIGIIADIHAILAEIEIIIKSLVAIVDIEAKALITAELTIVKSLILSLITPITGFSFSVSGSITSTVSASVKKELSVAASGLVVYAGKVLTL